MRAGRLRHVIVIESNTTVTNAQYEKVKSWVTHATVRASIEPMTAKEVLESQQLGTETNIIVRIRALATVTTEMRINWNSRIFQIDGIIDRDQRGIEMLLLCHEKL